MKLSDEAQAAANEAASKLRQSGVLDLMNYDPADVKNSISPHPVDLSPKKER